LSAKECKQKIEIHPEMARELGVQDEAPFEIYQPTGCPKCNGTGYKGRAGIYEVMVVSKKIKEMILDRCSTDEIKQQAIKEGMVTLRGDGIDKIKRGITSVEEVLKESSED
jgi:type IV pilus assembly protein PilB